MFLANGDDFIEQSQFNEFGVDLDRIFTGVIKDLKNKKFQSKWSVQISQFKEKHNMILTTTQASIAQEMDVELVDTVLDDDDSEKQRKREENEKKKTAEVRKNLFDTLSKIDLSAWTSTMLSAPLTGNTLRILSKEAEDCFKLIRYHQNCALIAGARAGKIFKRVKNTTDAKLGSFVKMTSFSEGYAYFLIRLYTIVERYPDFITCGLPLRYIRSNLTRIEKNIGQWEEWKPAV